MSETESRVVEAACHEIARCIGKENSNVRYELNFQKYDIQKEILPVALPKLLEVIQDSQFNTKILKEVLVKKLSDSLSDNILSDLSPNASSSSEFTYGKQGTGYNALRHPLISGRDSSSNTENQHSYNRQTPSLPSQTNFLEKSNYLKIRKRYLAILAAGMLCGTIAISCFVSILVWITTGSKDLSFMEGLNGACYPIVLLGHHVIRSLDQYNGFTGKNQMVEVAVAIRLTEPSDWPMGVPIETSKNITDLYVTGPLHAKKLNELLSHCPYLNTLTISNDCNKICSETQQQIADLGDNMVGLPQLNVLVLEKFKPTCFTFLEVLNNNLHFDQLQEFRLDKSTLNRVAMKSLRNILIQSASTLERIEILNSTVNAELFDTENQLESPSVTTIIYDVYENEYSGISKHFCSKFPKLQHFSFGNNLKTWIDIESIFGCQQLKTLNLKLRIPPEQRNFSLTFLSENFPRLESAEITLDFPKCAHLSKNRNDGSGNYLLGRNALSDLLLINIGITSNCDLIHI